MARGSRRRAGPRASISEDEPSSEEEFSDTDEEDLLPAYKKKPKKLTPDESLKRTIGTIPRAAVNEMLFQSIKDSKRITPADFDTTLRNVVDSGILQLPVEILIEIVAWLPVRDRILCMRTCRLFRALGTTQLAVWRTFILAKIEFQTKKERDPNLWIRRSTVAELIDKVPENSIRNLVVDDFCVKRGDLKSLLQKQTTSLKELTLFGGGFSADSFAPWPIAPHLQALRLINNCIYWRRQNDTFDSNNNFCMLVEAHDALKSLALGHRDFYTISAQSPQMNFHRNITSLLLDGSHYWYPVDILRAFDSFVNLREFGVSNVSFDSAYDFENVPVTLNTVTFQGLTGDSGTVAALDAENGYDPAPAPHPTTFRTAEIPRATLLTRRNRAEPPAKPTKVILRFFSSWNSGGQGGPIAFFSWANALARDSIEHLCILGEFPIVLHGEFNELQILDLELFTGRRLKNAQDNRRWSIAKGHMPLVFYGFVAPKLEKIIVHGDEKVFDGKEISEIVGENVEVVVTGKPRPAMMWSEMEMADFM